MRMDGGQGTFRSGGALSGAFDSNWREMEAGADFDLADTFAGGRLVGGITAHADWINADLSPSGVDSSLDGTGYGVGATLTWYGPAGFYLDGQAKATWFNADIAGAGASAEGIDGLGYALGIEAGRHIRLGGGWSLTPQAQLVYSRIDFDRFTDSSGVEISLRRGESLRGRAGLAVGRDFAFPRSGWQAGLYGLANVSYEMLGDTSVDAAGTALDWEPRQLWGDVGLGASIKASDGVSFFGEATYAASLQDFSASHTLTGRVGIRMQW
jgi:fibronectin-binding autotransporter adhesin